MTTEIEPVIGGKIEKYIGVLVRTPAGISGRDILIKEVLNKAKTLKGTKSTKPLLKIEAPCGAYTEWWIAEAIPEVDVPCPCGDPNHWLIKYEMS